MASPAGSSAEHTEAMAAHHSRRFRRSVGGWGRGEEWLLAKNERWGKGCERSQCPQTRCEGCVTSLSLLLGRREGRLVPAPHVGALGGSLAQEAP